jgi:hypothetical protein
MTNSIVREDDIVFFTHNDSSSLRWSKQFSSAFVYGQPNDDMLYYLSSLMMPRSAKINTKFYKLIVFDNCLSKAYINKMQFKKFMSDLAKNKISMIIMSGDNDLIIHNDILKIVDTVLLHSLTMCWTSEVSKDFIRRFPILKDQREMEKMMSFVSTKNGFLTVHSVPDSNNENYWACQY